MIRRVVRLIASTRPSMPRLISEAAGEAEQQGQREAPADRLLDQRLDLQAVLDLAPDQQAEAAGSAKLAPARGAARPSSPRGTSTVKSSSRRGPARPPASESRLPAIGWPTGVGQQVDAGALRLGGAAPLDHLAAGPRGPGARYCSASPVISAWMVSAVWRSMTSGGRDVEEAEQGQRRDPEQRQIDQRPAEGRGLKQPLQAHAGSTRRRARCGSAARSKPRSIFWRRRLMWTSITLVCGSKW